MNVFAPVFIVGNPRSGTTLLAALLDRHSHIAVTPETHFVDQLAYTRRLRRRPPPGHANIVDLIMRLNPRFQDLGFECSDLLDQFARYDPTYPALLRSALELYSGHRGARVAIEKTPRHLLFVQTLRAWFEHSRFICVIRDGRDTVQSLMRVPWTHRRRVQHAAEWAYQAELAGVYRKRLGESFFVIRYEDLVRNPVAALERVCGYLGERFERTQLDAGVSTSVVPEWEKPWKAAATEPIDKARVDSWRSCSEANELSILHRVMGAQLRSWGYEVPTSADQGWLTRLWNRMQTCPFRGAMYRGIRRGILIRRQVITTSARFGQTAVCRPVQQDRPQY